MPPGKIKQTAKKLLSGMDSEGTITPLIEIVEKMSFDKIASKLERRITIGNKVENLLNMMGRKFQFQAMLSDITDEILEVTSQYIMIMEADKEDFENELSSSFQVLHKKEEQLNKTDLEMGYKMEDLLKYINWQIDSMIRKHEQEMKKSALCSIGSMFVPGTKFKKNAIKEGIIFIIHVVCSHRNF